jgi:hypothetical protein
MNLQNTQCFHCAERFIIMLVLTQLFSGVVVTSLALSASSVEDLHGRINPGQGNFYTIPNLQQGDRLYIYVSGTSGNFDPFVAIGNTSVNASGLVADFEKDVNETIGKGGDPLDAIPETARKYFLAWNDDGGKGYDSAINFQVPASGDYQMLISSSPLRRTFGDYRLLVGVNSPQVLTGQAIANRKGIARLEKNLSEIGYAVQEIPSMLLSRRLRKT